MAELADNERWSALTQLAEQNGHEGLAQQCLEAIGHERDHLRKVRAWIAAGQGREMVEGEGAEMPEESDEFIFTEDASGRSTRRNRS